MFPRSGDSVEVVVHTRCVVLNAKGINDGASRGPGSVAILTWSGKDGAMGGTEMSSDDWKAWSPAWCYLEVATPLRGGA